MKTLSTRSRNGRRIRGRKLHSDKSPGQSAEPVFCPVCHAVFKDGRWQWLEAWPLEARQTICPACQRIRDNKPAGIVKMSGTFIRLHRQEVINLARSHEREERARHPLHRIISIEEFPDTVIVATTDVHLPKRIGRAMQRAGKGRLDLGCDRKNSFVCVNWIARETPAKELIPRKRRQF